MTPDSFSKITQHDALLRSWAGIQLGFSENPDDAQRSDRSCDVLMAWLENPLPPSLLELQAMAVYLRQWELVCPITEHYSGHPRRVLEIECAKCTAVSQLRDFAKGLVQFLETTTSPVWGKERICRAGRLLESVSTSKQSIRHLTMAQAWFKFLLFSNHNRLALVDQLYQTVETWTPKAREDAIRWLNSSIPASDQCELMVNYLAPHPGSIPTPNPFVVQAELQTSYTTVAQPKKMASKKSSFALPVLVLLFFILILLALTFRLTDVAGGKYENTLSPLRSRSPTSELAKSGDLRATLSILAGTINHSPFDKSANFKNIGFIHRYNGRTQDVVDTIHALRKRRWMFREQLMVRNFVAGLGSQNIPDQINLVDSQEWRATPEQIDELIRIFVDQGDNYEQDIRTLYNTNFLANAEFFRSAVSRFSDEEINILLQGELEQTLSLDQILYSDPREFEVVRKLREQNSKIERYPGSAYGHHLERKN